MKKFILVVIILAAGIALGVYFQKQSKTQKIEAKAQMDAERAGDAVKSGVQKADDAAADVKTDVKAGIQKTEDIATNAAGKIKAGAQKAVEFTTNAAGEIKAKLP